MCKSLNCKHKMKAEKFCTVPGCCGTFRVVRGLCNAHWLRWKKGDKSIQPQESKLGLAAGKVCSVEWCELSVYARGLCGPHYQRKLRNGSEHDVRQKKHGTIKAARPDLLKELVNKSNGSLTIGVATEVEWKCGRCQHKWTGPVYVRGVLNAGCDKCGRKQAGRTMATPKPGESFADKFPEIAAQMVDKSFGFRIKPNAHVSAEFKCDACGKTYTAHIGSKVKGSGCTEDCLTKGYKTSKPGYFYLLQSGGRLQIGITNEPKRRVDYTHARNGWEPIEVIGPYGGKNIKNLETQVKRSLKRNGIPTGEKAFREKFDGSTESWHAVDLLVVSISNLCSKLGINLDAFLAA